MDLKPARLEPHTDIVLQAQGMSEGYAVYRVPFNAPRWGVRAGDVLYAARSGGQDRPNEGDLLIVPDDRAGPRLVLAGRNTPRDKDQSPLVVRWICKS